MVKKKVIYSTYFKTGQQVKLGIRLSENLTKESSGELTDFVEDRARIELFGGDIPTAFSSMKPNSRLSLSGWSGWGFYCCDAILDEVVSAKDFIVRLVGDVDEIQRREFFRLDVSLPVVIATPPEQTLASLTEQWDEIRNRHSNAPAPEIFSTSKGYRAVTFDRKDIAPQGINLSGGGLRLRLPSKIAPGTRIHVDLYLPVAPPRIASVVAEVLRCNEITLRLEKDPVFITAMKFLMIDEIDREAIIAYLFAEQRIQLQNESERDFSSSSRL